MMCQTDGSITEKNENYDLLILVATHAHTTRGLAISFNKSFNELLPSNSNRDEYRMCIRVNNGAAEYKSNLLKILF